MSALLGGAAWAALVVAVAFGNDAFDRYRLLFMLAVLVFVPLGFDLAATPGPDGRNSALYRLARFVQPLAAVLAGASFLAPVGTFAAVLGAPWLAFTALVGLFGLERVRSIGPGRAEENCVSIALLYLPVGGAWFMADRLGIAPLGFGGVIAFLTAIHFHFAGLLAPLLTGLAGRALRRSAPARWGIYRVAAAGIMAGPLLVALGITFASGMEVVAATVLVLAVSTIAWLTFTAVAPSAAHPRARFLLRLSALASVAAMMLALLYATTGFFQQLAITIPQMAATHGVLNALYALAGLLAWNLERLD